MRLASLVLLAPLALSAASCSKKESSQSSDIATHGMSLDYKITVDDTKVSVIYIALHVGDFDSNQFACLSNGDELLIHLPNGETLTPQQQGACSTDGKTAYAVNSNIIDGTFTVDFVRSSGQSALGNSITLPPSFDLTAPTGTPSRTHDSVSIDFPAFAGIDVVVGIDDVAGGDCIVGETHDLGNAAGGNYVWNLSEVTKVAGHEQDSCDLVFTVTRKTSIGNFSTEFGYRNQADGEQSRSFTMTTLP